MNKYVIGMSKHQRGFTTLDVEADSEAQAEERALERLYGALTGGIEDVEWDMGDEEYGIDFIIQENRKETRNE